MDKIIYKTRTRIDGVNAAEVEAELKEILAKEPDELIIDMELTGYISSAGLRLLLSAQKNINKRKAKMLLINVSPSVKEIFDVTGFSGFLNMEQAG